MSALLDELAIDPERRRRWLIGLGGLALVAATSWGWNRHTEHMATLACEAEGAAVAEIWSEADADAIADAFGQTGLVHASDAWAHTAPRVDAWARDWAELRTRACLENKREHTRDPDVLRRARACFDEQGAHVRALVKRWNAPTRTVVSAASQAAWDLPSPSECLDPLVLARHDALDREDPRERADVQALRERLAEAEALHSMGHYEDALPLGESVLRQAATQNVPPLVVAARLRIGALHIEQGRFDEAQRTLRTTFLEAEALGDDLRATTAAWTLAFTLGYHLARFDEARDWSELASAKQTRLGLDPDDPRVADALRRQGTLAAIQRRPDEALALFTKAQAVTERALGPDHPDVSTSLNNLALAQFQAGHHDQAVLAYRRSTAIAVRAFGPHHPSVAYPLNNIALVLQAQGHHGLALRAIERALEIREAALGPGHLDVASSLINLGVVYQALGRNEDLLETSLRALEIWEGIYGPEHPRVARQHYNIGLAYGLLDRPAEALEQFERAHASAQERTDGDPELLFEYRVGMAQARLALGDADRAAQLLESSLRSAEERRIDPQAQAHARFVWARSLSTLGERSRALEQARIAARSAREDERIDIEAWIAAGAE